ncbi:MAG: PEP-CTERM sorting domain-containing protein [Phycisphaerales bacterium]|nr:MAG: PEP-CTERM sorting domain-containing protein [Phycisphaerales bacterium]
MMSRTFLTAVAVALFALSASAGAALITVPDASFEDHVLTEGGYEDIAAGSYTGAWECDSGDAWIDYGYWRADGWPEDLYAHSGNNKAYAYEDYIYQILDETFIEGVTYTLSAWVGQPWEGYASDWWLYFTTEDYTNELIETSGTAGLDWEQVSLEYTATAADAGHNIGIKMWGSSEVSFDDITLVPEPATLALLGLGALMLRRKRS